jgi:hypothetical protein
MKLVSCRISPAGVSSTGMKARPVRGMITRWKISGVGAISSKGMSLKRRAGRTFPEK